MDFYKKNQSFPKCLHYDTILLPTNFVLYVTKKKSIQHRPRWYSGDDTLHKDILYSVNCKCRAKPLQSDAQWGRGGKIPSRQLKVLPCLLVIYFRYQSEKTVQILFFRLTYLSETQRPRNVYLITLSEIGYFQLRTLI